MEEAVSGFLIHVESGSLYSEYNECLTFKCIPPPDPEHHSRHYDTFFACLAHHLKGDFHKRIELRDELLCHLGSVVFGKRYLRAYDVYNVATDKTQGPEYLKKAMRNYHHAQYILQHPAIQTMIHFAGAYHGCTKDERGGKLLGNVVKKWRHHPDVFSYVIACFVRDNLGNVPSAPRNGIPIHKRTQTTCSAIFLHLAMDVYPNWRPVLWKYDRIADAIEIVTSSSKTAYCFFPFRPSHLRDENTSISVLDKWHNNAKPLYMFYNGIKKRYMLLCPTGLMNNPNVPPPNAIFSLRRGSATKRNNKHVTYLLPHHQYEQVHLTSIQTLHKTPSKKHFYMIAPANKSDMTYRIERPQSIFIYASRPSKNVLEDYKQKHVNRLWESSSNIPLDSPSIIKHDIEEPQWLSSEYVMVYTSHEARSGVCPIFILKQDVRQLIVIIAKDKDDSLDILQMCFPNQPLVHLNESFM